MTMATDTTGQLTGRKVTAIFVVFFGIVMAVNFTMAHFASSTFGGVVVENSYVASQHYNAWLDAARAQQALGWSATTRRAADGRVEVSLAGVPAQGMALEAEARHPLGRQRGEDDA